jgi:membrane associated rhomboid family serine protease
MSGDFVATQPLDETPSGQSQGGDRPVATLIIVFLMLGVTGAGAYLSNSLSEISNGALLKLGGNLPQATLDRYGQWRLLAAKLQMGSLLNAAVFVPFFWVVAAAFERRYGSVAVLVIFVLSSLLTGAATLYLLNNEQLVSVGGGGPALCLATCMITVSVLEGDWRRSLLRWRNLATIPFLLLTASGIAKGAADLYSLSCGAIFGLVVAAALPRHSAEATNHLTARLLSGSLVVCMIVTIAWLKTPMPTYFLSEAEAFRAAAPRYTAEMDELNKRLTALTDEVMEGRLSRQQLGVRVELELLPDWQRSASRWQQQSFNPAVPDGHKLVHMMAYLTHRRKFLEASAHGWTTESVDAFAQASVHMAKAETARAAMARRQEDTKR